MIKAYVTYTIDHFKAINPNPTTLSKKILWVTVTLLSTAFAVFIAVNDNAYFNIFTLLAIALWLGIILYIVLYSIMLNPEKLMKKYTETSPDSHLVFDFGEDSFNVTHESGNSSGSNNYNYSMVDLSWEKDDFFIIQVKSVGMFAIKKSEITNGTPDDLRQLLENKLFSKFEVK